MLSTCLRRERACRRLEQLLHLVFILLFKCRLHILSYLPLQHFCGVYCCGFGFIHWWWRQRWVWFIGFWRSDGQFDLFGAWMIHLGVNDSLWGMAATWQVSLRSNERLCVHVPERQILKLRPLLANFGVHGVKNRDRHATRFQLHGVPPGAHLIQVDPLLKPLVPLLKPLCLLAVPALPYLSLTGWRRVFIWVRVGSLLVPLGLLWVCGSFIARALAGERCRWLAWGRPRWEGVLFLTAAVWLAEVIARRVVLHIRGKMIRVGLVQVDHPITSPAFFHSAEEFLGRLRLSMPSACDYQEVSVLSVFCVLLYFVI